jgi:hypothetical protein
MTIEQAEAEADRLAGSIMAAMAALGPVDTTHQAISATILDYLAPKCESCKGKGWWVPVDEHGASLCHAPTCSVCDGRGRIPFARPGT